MWRPSGRLALWILGLTLYKIVENWALGWVQAHLIEPNTSHAVKLLVQYLPIFTWLMAAVGLVWATHRVASLPEHSGESPSPIGLPPTPASSATPNLDTLPIALGAAITPTAAPDIAGEKETPPVSFPGNATVLMFKLALGDFRDILMKYRTVRIELREIRAHTDKQVGEGEHGAVLYVGGPLVYGGERTTKLGVNCYYVPVNTVVATKEPYSVYSQYFSALSAAFFAAHIEHINPRSGVVTITACHVG